MPSSKEVRARQNRQKERIAAQLAERQRVNARRKRIALVAGLVIFVGAVALVLVVTVGNSNNKKAAATPTTTAPSQCVGLKQAVPKGAPEFTIPAGPAPTKLATRDLKVGTGAVVPANAKLQVNYVGVACSTGKIFDSSYSRHQPLEANLNGGVIPGWSQGIPGMKIGGVRVITIPANLAYGASGSPPSIGPNEPLYFLVAPVKLG